MTVWQNPGLPHLSGAVRYLGPQGGNGQGKCFQRSVALAMDLPDATLAIGTLHAVSCAPFIDEVAPFLHAWVEQADRVIAPTLIEENGNLYHHDRSAYYQRNGIRGVTLIPGARLCGSRGLAV